MDAKVILEKLQNFALKSGLFSSVQGHEPKSPPQLGDQITLAFMTGGITPATSGLKSVSLRWEVRARIFMNADSEPADDVDPTLVTVALQFMNALCGQFKLTGDVRSIDVYGSDGEPLRAEPGYYDYNGDTLRVMDIFIPILVNDQMDLGA
jgi:hypothetical protein